MGAGLLGCLSEAKTRWDQQGRTCEDPLQQPEGTAVVGLQGVGLVSKENLFLLFGREVRVSLRGQEGLFLPIVQPMAQMGTKSNRKLALPSLPQTPGSLQGQQRTLFPRHCEQHLGFLTLQIVEDTRAAMRLCSPGSEGCSSSHGWTSGMHSASNPESACHLVPLKWTCIRETPVLDCCLGRRKVRHPQVAGSTHRTCCLASIWPPKQNPGERGRCTQPLQSSLASNGSHWEPPSRAVLPVCCEGLGNDRHTPCVSYRLDSKQRPGNVTTASHKGCLWTPRVSWAAPTRSLRGIGDGRAEEPSRLWCMG